MNPFETLRARGLLVQCLVGGVIAIALGALAFGQTSMRSNQGVAFALFYFGMGLVLLVRVENAGLDTSRLFGAAPGLQTLRLATVALPLAILSIAGFWLLFLPLSFAAPEFVRHWALESQQQQPMTNMSQWLSMTFVAVVAAPLVEEVLFRGLLLQRWSLKWGTPTAVVATSALFAVGHVELLGHFLFGVVMCALYLRTKSLWVPIVTHASNNLLASLSMLPSAITHKPDTERMTLAGFRSQWWAGLAMLAVGAVLLESYRRSQWKGVDLRKLFRGPTPYLEAEASPSDRDGAVR